MTICSQGWVPDVVNRVLDKQFRDYLDSEGISIEKLNGSQIQSYKADYAKAMYPGSKLPPDKIISQLTSQNPEVTLSSEVLVDQGYDECENLAGDTVQDLSCPWDAWNRVEIDNDGSRKIFCINEDVNFGMLTTGGTSFPIWDENCMVDPYMPHCSPPDGTMTGNTCTFYGANRLRFSLEDSALQERLFELYCEWQNRWEPQSQCKHDKKLFLIVLVSVVNLIK